MAGKNRAERSVVGWAIKCGKAALTFPQGCVGQTGGEGGRGMTDGPASGRGSCLYAWDAGSFPTPPPPSSAASKPPAPASGSVERVRGLLRDSGRSWSEPERVNS